jgi:superfamily II DNA/RNA helicase
LNKLFRDPRGIFSIILVPRREVALQICEQINFFGQQNNIRCIPVIGGVDYTTQKKKLEQQIPHIVVGTPGRLAE